MYMYVYIYIYIYIYNTHIYTHTHINNVRVYLSEIIVGEIRVKVVFDN